LGSDIRIRAYHTTIDGYFILGDSKIAEIDLFSLVVSKLCFIPQTTCQNLTLTDSLFCDGLFLDNSTFKSFDGSGSCVLGDFSAPEKVTYWENTTLVFGNANFEDTYVKIFDPEENEITSPILCANQYFTSDHGTRVPKEFTPPTALANLILDRIRRGETLEAAFKRVPQKRIHGELDLSTSSKMEREIREDIHKCVANLFEMAEENSLAKNLLHILRQDKGNNRILEAFKDGPKK